ncbi:MAG: hypothetical protein NTX25_20775 [Proteobacteria bacterium]|nr:hypothetical protein [Pseudomonadota bacterium]
MKWIHLLSLILLFLNSACSNSFNRWFFNGSSSSKPKAELGSPAWHSASIPSVEELREMNFGDFFEFTLSLMPEHMELEGTSYANLPNNFRNIEGLREGFDELSADMPTIQDFLNRYDADTDEPSYDDVELLTDQVNDFLPSITEEEGPQQLLAVYSDEDLARVMNTSLYLLQLLPGAAKQAATLRLAEYYSGDQNKDYCDRQGFPGAYYPELQGISAAATAAAAQATNVYTVSHYDHKVNSFGCQGVDNAITVAPNEMSQLFKQVCTDNRDSSGYNKPSCSAGDNLRCLPVKISYGSKVVEGYVGSFCPEFHTENANKGRENPCQRGHNHIDLADKVFDALGLKAENNWGGSCAATVNVDIDPSRPTPKVLE